MIKVKTGVQFHPKSLRCSEALRMLWIAQREAPVGYEMTITSGCDGEHKVNSAHYRGEAFDLRTRDLQIHDVEVWVENIQEMLGGNYFVLLESDHIHMQVRT